MVCLIVSPEGVAALLDAFPTLSLVAGMLDDHIDQRKFIVPGVGQSTALTLRLPDGLLRWRGPGLGTASGWRDRAWPARLHAHSGPWFTVVACFCFCLCVLGLAV